MPSDLGGGENFYLESHRQYAVSSRVRRSRWYVGFVVVHPPWWSNNLASGPRELCVSNESSGSLPEESKNIKQPSRITNENFWWIDSVLQFENSSGIFKLLITFGLAVKTNNESHRPSVSNTRWGNGSLIQQGEFVPDFLIFVARCIVSEHLIVTTVRVYN